MNMMSTSVKMFSVFFGLVSLIVLHVYAEKIYENRYRDQMVRMDGFKASFPTRVEISPSPSSGPLRPPNHRIYRVTSYGADPTGETDSTEALLRAITDAFQAPNGRDLMQGIVDLGGAEVHLEGGSYKISRPLRLPSAGGGNLLIHGGSLRASDDFPIDRHLIELWPSSSPKLNTRPDQQKDLIPIEDSLSSFASAYEDITIRDLMLDSNYRGGGISVINSLRTSIDNCYIVHFSTDGVLVQGGHETYIRNSFLGQHITAGGDNNEKNFSGVAINLMGNDNAVTDVVIFSAEIGVLISGQANTLTGVHCYNKATGWGGTGIYLRLPNLTQTRISNCYLDYTGIVAEDPVQLHITGSFFLGNAFILLKSINGVARGLNIVDNMFCGDDTGVDIVQLDQSNGSFKTIDQVVIDRNNVRGMTLRSTVARGLTQGNGSTWTVDFSSVLLFPNLINHVQYTLQTTSDSFPNHALRNVSENRIIVETDVAVPATLYASVDQGISAV